GQADQEQPQGPKRAVRILDLGRKLGIGHVWKISAGREVKAASELSPRAPDSSRALPPGKLGTYPNWIRALGKSVNSLTDRRALERLPQHAGRGFPRVAPRLRQAALAATLAQGRVFQQGLQVPRQRLRIAWIESQARIADHLRQGRRVRRDHGHAAGQDR